VENQRLQPQLLLGNIGQIRAVNPSAHADDAVEVLIGPLPLNGRNEAIQFLLSPLIRVPVGKNLSIEGVTMVADAFLVEDDLRVSGVHDTVGANLKRSIYHYLGSPLYVAAINLNVSSAHLFHEYFCESSFALMPNLSLKDLSINKDSMASAIDVVSSGLK